MKPFQSFKKTIACRCCGGLDVPLAVLDIAQVQLFRNLANTHGIRKVLLVRIHKQHGITQLVLIEHPLQLISSIINAVTIIRINDKDDGYKEKRK